MGGYRSGPLRRNDRHDASHLRTAFPLPAGRARPFTWPWQDRAGRLSSPARRGLRPAAGAGRLGGGGGGVRPAGAGARKAATKEIGLWTIRLLLLTLAVTPVGKILAEPRILALRRLFGLVTLAYAMLHLRALCGA